MDEKHSSVPPFEKSADAHEAWQQQQIATLTPEQRQAFDEMRKGQSKEQDQLKEKQQDQYKDRVDEKTRRHLLQSKELHHRPKDSRAGFVSKQDDMNMLKDFLDGKNTPAIMQNRERIQSAQQKAVGDVQSDQKHEASKMESLHQKDQVKFLVKAEKQRNFAENAKDATQKTSQREFTKAVDEKAWKNAMDLAKKQENQHDRNDRNKDDRSR